MTLEVPTDGITLGFARTSCCGVSANGVADQPSASRNYGPWNATPLLTLLPRHYHARTVKHHELGTHAERLVRLSPDSDQIADILVGPGCAKSGQAGRPWSPDLLHQSHGSCLTGGGSQMRS
jgi:hypothetical protein